MKSKAITATFYLRSKAISLSLSQFLVFYNQLVFPVESFMASSKINSAHGNSHKLSDLHKKVRIVGKIRGHLESEAKSTDGSSSPWISVQKSSDCVTILCKDQTSRYSTYQTNYRILVSVFGLNHFHLKFSTILFFLLNNFDFDLGFSISVLPSWSFS